MFLKQKKFNKKNGDVNVFSTEMYKLYLQIICLVECMDDLFLVMFLPNCFLNL